MSSEAFVCDSNLDKALAEIESRVRQSPSDAGLRVHLFQICSVLGQWQRASQQIAVALQLDPGKARLAQVYQTVLECEQFRRDVMAGKVDPIVLGEPLPWIALLIQANRVAAAGDEDQAARLRADAVDQSPATPGEADGVAFESLIDGDSRFGPVIECIVDGKYYWSPIARLKGLVMHEPENLQDVVWCRADFVWTTGGRSEGFIPTRYPGTETSNDSELRLSRRTDWVEGPHGSFRGLGQRTFLTAAGDLPLLSTRIFTFANAGDGGAGAGSAAAGGGNHA